MDIFGEDSDSEDNNTSQIISSSQEASNVREIELTNALFVNIVKAKSAITKNSCNYNARKSIRYCLIHISNDTSESSSLVDIMHKRLVNDLKVPKESISTVQLTQAQHISRKLSQIVHAVHDEVFDVVVFLHDVNHFLKDTMYFSVKTNQNLEIHMEEYVYTMISPVGYLISFQQNQSCKVSEEFNRLNQYFIPVAEEVRAIAVTETLKSALMKKRPVLVNPYGAAYWKEAQLESALQGEIYRIQSLCIEVSAQERLSGCFTAANQDKAVSCLQEHGICIFPQLFDPQEVLTWGAAAKEDMRQVVQALWTSRGIDLLHPYADSAEASAPQPFIENFHEMSTREALRCDLRNGQAVRRETQRLYGSAGTSHQAADAISLRAAIVELSSAERVSPLRNLRYHPGLLQVLSQVMNCPSDGAVSSHSGGNWGLWNFGGEGPDKPPAPAVGQVGVVMGLPGCADQTIHADTAHVFTHTAHLPPHYLNLFLPAVAASLEDSLRMGQTAFVLGSHHLQVSAAVMTRRGGQRELIQRLVRPHLQAGDALLFDCRILHFGLANQHLNRHLREPHPSTPEQGKQSRHPLDAESEEFWRPLLYVNYHQGWFRDPKNWNDAIKLIN
mmetsp:Transcript_19764/g.28230  ORF Transcript_19764/g.28230 Transcript_19764/m.28230 type:complete len:614 (-) Transcript_19764:3214-5055(-)